MQGSAMLLSYLASLRKFFVMKLFLRGGGVTGVFLVVRGQVSAGNPQVRGFHLPGGGFTRQSPPR